MLLSQQTNTTFYCKGGSVANDHTNWNTSPTGDGTDLAVFEGEHNTYIIQYGQTVANTSHWTITGSGATLVVDSGATLEAPYRIEVPCFEVKNTGTYIHSMVSAELNGTESDIPGTVSRVFASNSNEMFHTWANGGSTPVTLPYTSSWGNVTIDVACLGGDWINVGFDYGRIYGDLIIKNTGGGSHEFMFNGTTRIYGTVNVQGGILTVSNSSSGGTVYFQASEGIRHTGGVIKTTGTDIVEIEMGSADSVSTFYSIGGSSYINTNIKYFTTGRILMLLSDLPIAASRQFVAQGNIDCGISALKGAGSVYLGQRIFIGSPYGIAASGSTGNIQVTGERVYQSGSAFVYNGSSAQYIGDGFPALTDTLIINNSYGVTLSGNISIDDRLILQLGNLYTNTSTLTLGDHALMTGETAGRSVVGTLVADMRIFGNVGNQLGNIGVDLDPYSALFALSVERKSGSAGIVSATGQEGLARRWKLTHWNGYDYTTADVTVTLSWLSDDDNGKNVSVMRIWKSTNTGTSWNAIGGIQNASSNRQVSFDIGAHNPISGEFTVSDEASALPVELSSFTAQTAQQLVQLKWRTEGEVNNYGFEIEKLSNSKIIKFQNSAWEKIGFVEGNGTSNTPKEYSFVDRSVNTGQYQYRLKQIDRDGKFTYTSAIIAAIAAAPAVFGLEQNYPNPFNPTTDLSFTVGTAGHVTLKVFNALGQEVAMLFRGAAEAGTYHRVSFNAAQLPSGTYFAKLTAGDKTQIRKMLLMK
jgi:hypothetical protein